MLSTVGLAAVQLLLVFASLAEGVVPQIKNLNVKCDETGMKVEVDFDVAFNGIIYSKGHYSDQNCSGNSYYQFYIPKNGCGTLRRDAVKTGSVGLENVVIFQNDPEFQEVWDTAKRLKCSALDRIDKVVTFAPVAVDMLRIEEIDFTDDSIDCWMEIQRGVSPFSPPISGIVPIGEKITVAIYIRDRHALYDIHVKDCYAYDSPDYNDPSTRKVPLTDVNGCPVKEKILKSFYRTRNTKNTGATIIAYGVIDAFKFPEKVDVYVACNVEICKRSSGVGKGEQQVPITEQQETFEPTHTQEQERIEDASKQEKLDQVQETIETTQKQSETTQEKIEPKIDTTQQQISTTEEQQQMSSFGTQQQEDISNSEEQTKSSPTKGQEIIDSTQEQITNGPTQEQKTEQVTQNQQIESEIPPVKEGPKKSLPQQEIFKQIEQETPDIRFPEPLRTFSPSTAARPKLDTSLEEREPFVSYFASRQQIPRIRNEEANDEGFDELEDVQEAVRIVSKFTEQQKQESQREKPSAIDAEIKAAKKQFKPLALSNSQVLSQDQYQGNGNRGQSSLALPLVSSAVRRVIKPPTKTRLLPLFEERRRPRDGEGSGSSKQIRKQRSNTAFELESEIVAQRLPNIECGSRDSSENAKEEPLRSRRKRSVVVLGQNLTLPLAQSFAVLSPIEDFGDTELEKWQRAERSENQLCVSITTAAIASIAFVALSIAVSLGFAIVANTIKRRHSFKPVSKYVKENSLSEKYEFKIPIEGCGTVLSEADSAKGFENILIFQNDPIYQEVWDSARLLSCRYIMQKEEPISEKRVVFKPFLVDGLDVIKVPMQSFVGDAHKVDCWMDIKLGKYPDYTEITGPVKVGQNLTLLIAIKDTRKNTDIRVKDCYAFDNAENAESNDKALLKLSGEDGCPLKPKIMDVWRRTKKVPDRPEATLMAYTTITAFKFPQHTNVHLTCNVELCKEECADRCEKEPKELIPDGGNDVSSKKDDEEDIATQETIDDDEEENDALSVTTAKPSLPLSSVKTSQGKKNKKGKKITSSKASPAASALKNDRESSSSVTKNQKKSKDSAMISRPPAFKPRPTNRKAAQSPDTIPSAPKINPQTTSSSPETTFKSIASTTSRKPAKSTTRRRKSKAKKHAKAKNGTKPERSTSAPKVPKSGPKKRLSSNSTHQNSRRRKISRKSRPKQAQRESSLPKPRALKSELSQIQKPKLSAITESTSGATKTTTTRRPWQPVTAKRFIWNQTTAKRRQPVAVQPRSQVSLSTSRAQTSTTTAKPRFIKRIIEANRSTPARAPIALPLRADNRKETLPELPLPSPLVSHSFEPSSPKPSVAPKPAVIRRWDDDISLKDIGALLGYEAKRISHIGTRHIRSAISLFKPPRVVEITLSI
ncbi:uncharacterized protein B4U79_01259 [Dinothrombium tinctorium]|uniref:ZP domain-containing protein n=1 Tax=Dinothrombium tinctorium TaxID=1965070 RepID=A0A3S3SIX1_9ACAR|nr:uncharacterized protein B4U79_01259 [Dinothrombium tinctorium]